MTKNANDFVTLFFHYGENGCVIHIVFTFLITAVVNFHLPNVGKWLGSMTYHLPLTAVDSNPVIWNFGFFHVRKLSS